jgi:hypothetical protein
MDAFPRPTEAGTGALCSVQAQVNTLFRKSELVAERCCDGLGIVNGVSQMRGRLVAVEYTSQGKDWICSGMGSASFYLLSKLRGVRLAPSRSRCLVCLRSRRACASWCVGCTTCVFRAKVIRSRLTPRPATTIYRRQKTDLLKQINDFDQLCSVNRFSRQFRGDEFIRL